VSIARSWPETAHQDAIQRRARFVTARLAQPAGEVGCLVKERTRMFGNCWGGRPLTTGLVRIAWSKRSEAPRAGFTGRSISPSSFISVPAITPSQWEPARDRDLGAPLPTSTGRPWPPPSPVQITGGRGWPVPTPETITHQPHTLEYIGHGFGHAQPVPVGTVLDGHRRESEPIRGSRAPAAQTVRRPAPRSPPGGHCRFR